MCGNEKQEGCRKPENLTGKPEECSPEQVKKCHREAGEHPCVEATDCEHPERLKGKPGECSSEQIRECHGTDAEHPCDTSMRSGSEAMNE